MTRILLIDGENFKGKLRYILSQPDQSKPLWHEYDFKGLFDQALGDLSIDQKIFYFAKIKEHEATKDLSRRLIHEQRLLKTHLEKQGFQVILSGRVRGHEEVQKNGSVVLIFKEKGVDVKIAVDMVTLACDKKVDEIILASSDSDLQPAIHEVRNRHVSCVYVGFEDQPNKGMTFTTNRTILIRNSEVRTFQNQGLFPASSGNAGPELTTDKPQRPD